MTQNSTPKRQREYYLRLLDASNMERTAELMFAVADAMEHGTLPPEFAELKTKADFASLVYKGTLSGGYYEVNVDPDYRDTSAVGKIAQQMIENARDAESAGAVAERERLAVIDKKVEAFRFLKIKGFFPTPRLIVEQMLEIVDIQPGEEVLEPSAGLGDIADVIKELHPDAELSAIEIRPALVEILTLKGHATATGDFLDHMRTYDVIVMNPPFERVKGAGWQDIAHILHAYELLNPGGRLVSLASAGAISRTDSETVGFIELLSIYGAEVTTLEDRAFKAAFRGTSVNVAMIVIPKQEQD